MKRIGIEALLRWAYLEELPKVAPVGRGPGGVGNGWGAVGSYVALLAVIDDNRFGVVPNLAEIGDPHPDAVAVHEAVAELDLLAIDEFDPLDLIADMRDLGRPILAALALALERASWVDGDGDRRIGGGGGALVRTRAILGRPTPPIGEVPKVVPLVGANGRPVWRRMTRAASAWNGEGEAIAWRDVEVDVVGAKGRMPKDAYQVMVVRPDPSSLIAERLRWMVWAAGLDALAASLSGRLTDHEVEPAGLPYAPWSGEEVRERRVLTSRGWGSDVGPETPRRPVALRRKAKGGRRSEEEKNRQSA